jgi:hypothetical protein
VDAEDGGLSAVQAGAGLFTGAAGAAGGGGGAASGGAPVASSLARFRSFVSRATGAAEAEAGAAADARCFSLVCGGRGAAHLQLPPGGNGRSRDEWVAALQELL